MQAGELHDICASLPFVPCYIFFLLLFIYSFIYWNQELTLGPGACQAGTLLLSSTPAFCVPYYKGPLPACTRKMGPSISSDLFLKKIFFLFTKIYGLLWFGQWWANKPVCEPKWVVTPREFSRNNWKLNKLKLLEWSRANVTLKGKKIGPKWKWGNLLPKWCRRFKGSAKQIHMNKKVTLFSKTATCSFHCKYPQS